MLDDGCLCLPPIRSATDAEADLPAPAARKWFSATSANPAFGAAEGALAGGPPTFARFASSCGLGATSGSAGAVSFAPPTDPSGELFTLTTAINYANGLPHMGHAYEAVSSDSIARYHRLFGRRVLFMTGADEHGQKIADTAAVRGLKPIELCDMYVAAFQELNKKLKVTNDVYNRTTSAKHKVTCAKLLELSMAKGDVYLDSYEGWCATSFPASLLPARLPPCAARTTVDAHCVPSIQIRVIPGELLHSPLLFHHVSHPAQV